MRVYTSPRTAVFIVYSCTLRASLLAALLERRGLTRARGILGQRLYGEYWYLLGLETIGEMVLKGIGLNLFARGIFGMLLVAVMKGDV